MKLSICPRSLRTAESKCSGSLRRYAKAGAGRARLMSRALYADVTRHDIVGRGDRE
jgi:hypothetical protein